MKRRGFTLIELLVVVAIIALLIAILLPSLGKARELSNRSVCAANIRGIGQSMAVYAKDNNDAYPIVSSTGGAGLASTAAGSPNASVDTLLSSLGIYANTSGKASVPQNMWILVLTGQVAPKQYLCKSDPATTMTAVANYNGKYQTNFNDGVGNFNDYSYSYSFAYPWTTSGPVGGWWRDTTDAGLPLMSDMAPNGTSGSSGTNTNTPSDKQSNSFNHQRDGQNVGFGDSHAEFARRPDCGQSADNIFTGCKDNHNNISSGTVCAKVGDAPTVIGTGGTSGAYDVCLVPVANASSSYLRQ
jgi:prepilin-type N-terminal cleavage/methylation domain-containing protein